MIYFGMSGYCANGDSFSENWSAVPPGLVDGSGSGTGSGKNEYFNTM